MKAAYEHLFAIQNMQPKLIYIDFSRPGILDRSLLFEGKVVIVQKAPPVSKLREYVMEEQKRILDSEEPYLIHEQMAPAKFNQLKMELNGSLEKDAKVGELMRELTEWLGWSVADANFDRPIMRMNPPLSFSSSGEVTPLRSFTKIHRDTWGINIMSQINLWAPVYPIEAANTFAFYTQYWTEAVPNTTAEWSYGEYLKKKNEGYSLMPVAKKDVSASPHWKALLEPGELLVFSSAHMHGSLPNQSDRTRINFETRVFFDADEHEGVGAPNLDTHGKSKALRIFKKL